MVNLSIPWVNSKIIVQHKLHLAANSLSEDITEEYP